MSDVTHDRINLAVNILRELRDTEPLLQVRGLLEQLEVAYKDALADVSAAELAKTQGALKQVTAIKNAIWGPPGHAPRL